MSIVYTSLYCSRIISKINEGSLNSWDQVYSELKSGLDGEYRCKGLADMCWRLKSVHLDYAHMRGLFYRYEDRFAKWPKYKEYTDLQKEKIVFLLEAFESKTTVFCGKKYAVEMTSEFKNEDGERILGPYVYFYPYISGKEPVLAMEEESGAKILFSSNSEACDSTARMKFWKIGGIYSLNKLISGINDGRIKLRLVSEV